MDEIERNVLSSYKALDAIDGFDFPASLGGALKTHEPRLLDLLGRIRNQVAAKNGIHPWLDFKIHRGESLYESYQRHSSLKLMGNSPTDRVARVGIISGTFDPFHLGHLLMGLNHLANGSSDFIVYLPNADAWIDGTPGKSQKNNYAWRFETVMNGGVEDVFPLLRASSFTGHGEKLVIENQELIGMLDQINYNIILGSDIFKKPHMVDKLRSDYETFQQTENHPGKIKITFFVVQRKDRELDETEIAQIKKNLGFPLVIEPSVSDASSTASSTKLKEGIENGILENLANLYPSSLKLLEPYIRSHSRAPGSASKARSRIP